MSKQSAAIVVADINKCKEVFNDRGFHDDGKHVFSVVFGRKGFMVKSSGVVDIKSVDTDFLNDRGSSVGIKAGDGTNPIGGKGGHIVLEVGYGVHNKESE